MLTAHYSFDEAHMSNLTNTLPPYALALQRAGYRDSLEVSPSTASSSYQLKYKT